MENDGFTSKYKHIPDSEIQLWCKESRCFRALARSVLEEDLDNCESLIELMLDKAEDDEIIFIFVNALLNAKYPQYEDRLESWYDILDHYLA